MLRDVELFYDQLAENFHLIFEDWNTSMQRQGAALKHILNRELGSSRPLRILDCACGIGTQALPLAQLGYDVTASDISTAAVARARAEASARDLHIQFLVADIRDLSAMTQDNFDVALCLDNALPHLESDDELFRALSQIRSKLRSGGRFLASIRDYDALLQQRPVVQAPAFYSDHGRRCIVHQLWDWLDERRYLFHLFITRELQDKWDAQHYVSNYRAVRRDELSTLAQAAGYTRCRWSDEFYQPLLIATV